MEFVIPESEGFMRINGESTSERVENIEFSGIQFSYDDYNLEVIDYPENGLHAVGYGGVQTWACTGNSQTTATGITAGIIL